MFALARQATEELWTTDSFGTRVLSADEILKYKVCSANNGAGVKFVPYTSIDFTGSQKDKGISGYVAFDRDRPNHLVDFSEVKLCSNPTW